MPTEPIITPPSNSPTSQLVDWLELVAFFNEYGVARLDALLGALGVQDNEPEEDIGDQGTAREQIIDEIENEIQFRNLSCGDYYPFILSGDAEELDITRNWSDQDYSFYLVCLLASHMTNSPLTNFNINDELARRLRNRIFQVVSNLAMAGLARGPALSLGWPRESDETILQIVNRAAKMGAGIVAQKTPGPYANPRAKDGGIDSLSWSITDRPPPTFFCYGQVASGHNWRGKPVTVHVETFNNNYILDGPRGNKNYATLIPFRVHEDSIWFNEHLSHGSIIDRTRIPPYAAEGMRLADTGIEIDESDNIDQITNWIADYRNDALAG